MEEKTCKLCGESKELSEFRYRDKSKGTRRVRCRDCERKEDCRLRKLRPRYKEQNRYKQVVSLFKFNYRILEYLLEHPCVDCGEPDPLKLEFDHVKGKEREIPFCRNLSWEDTLVEISKCEIRCGSCHRKVTHERKNSTRYLIIKELGLY